MSFKRLLFFLGSITTTACGEVPGAELESITQAVAVQTELSTGPHGGDGTRAGDCFRLFGFIGSCVSSSGLPGARFHELHARGRLAMLNVWSGKYIDSIQMIWQDEANPFILDGSDRVGGRKGTLKSFVFEPGEAIVKVAGRSGRLVDQLEITTNYGRTMRWGGSGGRPFEENVGQFGRQIHGAKVLAGQYIDAISFFSYLP